MQPITIQKQLTQKQELIAAIHANAEKLRRFIPNRNMLGIKRVLKETNQLIEELGILDKALAGQVNWQQFPADIKQGLVTQRDAMIHSYQQALQETIAVRHEIADKLRSISNSKQLKNSYNPWTPRPGRRISLKG